MARIDWRKFSKSELVTILEALDERPWLIERLDAEDNHYLAHGCSCDVVVEALPAEILRIRDNAKRRGTGPLSRLLRRSPMEHRKQA